MHGNKENQEISVLGRLVSLEALVLVMGAVSLVYGLVCARPVNIVIGVAILAASLIVKRLWKRLRR